MYSFKRLILLLLFPSLATAALSSDTISAAYGAHAHNDYLHERPFFDALGNGFRSLEADVFSRGDSLYLAHDRKDIQPGRTLRKLYLEPLMRYYSEDRLGNYNQDHPLILLVDIKDHGLTTYQLLEHILKEFREILCQLTPEGYVGGIVKIVISGNRPIDYMRQQTQRFAFVDGRIADLAAADSPQLMPLISDRWTKFFSWRGKGEMPEEERAQLRSYVQQAHKNGQLIRFWSTPDNPGVERQAVWRVLLEAGVDLVNTDDLTGLREFFQAGGFQ